MRLDQLLEWAQKSGAKEAEEAQSYLEERDEELKKALEEQEK